MDADVVADAYEELHQLSESYEPCCDAALDEPREIHAVLGCANHPMTWHALTKGEGA